MGQSTWADGFESIRLANKQKKKSGLDDEKMSDLMDKQDDILTKFKLLERNLKENKQNYANMEETMDGIKEENERYYNGTIKKMGDYYSKLNASVNNIEMNVEQKVVDNSNGGGDNSFAAQMSTAN